jgi:TPR repeat protein
MHEAQWSLRQFEFYAKACDGGLLEGCSPSPGIYVTSDRTFVRDIRRMAASAQRECDGGNGSSCILLGDIYAGRNPDDQDYGRIPQDFVKARQSYERASTLGSVRGGVILAGLLADGQGGPRDSQRATRLFLRACEANDDLGCYMLGWSYETGDGAPKDVGLAKKAYDRACAMGRHEACDRGRLVGPMRGTK